MDLDLQVAAARRVANCGRGGSPDALRGRRGEAGCIGTRQDRFYAVEARGERGEITESVDDVTPHPGDVGRSCLLEPFPTSPGELGQCSPAVLGASPPGYQTFSHEPVEASCQTASREEKPAGELRHPKRPALGFGEVDQHVVVPERKAVSCPELVVEPLPQAALDHQQVSPDILLLLTEPPHRGTS
jgi:hypothetical protein